VLAGDGGAARPVVAVARAVDRIDLRKVRANAAAAVTTASARPFAASAGRAVRPGAAAAAFAAGIAAAAGPRRPVVRSLGASFRLLRFI